MIHTSIKLPSVSDMVGHPRQRYAYTISNHLSKMWYWRGIPTRSLREENAIDGSTAVDPQRGILAPVARKHVLASTHQCICWARRVGGRVHFYGNLRLFSCQEGRLDGIRPS